MRESIFNLFNIDYILICVHSDVATNAEPGDPCPVYAGMGKTFGRRKLYLLLLRIMVR